MKFTVKRRTWKLFYAICCLFYIGWVSYLSSNDFDRITREYRRAGEQVEPGRIRSEALQELWKECRKKYQMQAHDIKTAENGSPAFLIEEGGQTDRDCLTWPSAVVEAREAEVRKRLEKRQERAGWKLLLFSLFFVVIFLVIPPVVFYIFAALVVKLFKSVKIVRK